MLPLIAIATSVEAGLVTAISSDEGGVVITGLKYAFYRYKLKLAWYKIVIAKFIFDYNKKVV